MASKYTRYTDPKFKKNFLNPQNRDSLYFNNDYEEPTYLGFKIEFGDLGASLLSESVMRSQSSYLSNSVSMDYAAFPCGLMDLNFVNNPSDTINMFSSANTDAAYHFEVDTKEPKRAWDTEMPGNILRNTKVLIFSIQSIKPTKNGNQRMNEIFSPKRPELFKRYFKIKKVRRQ